MALQGLKLLFPLLLIACDEKDPGPSDTTTSDADNDGFSPESGDCDDADAAVYPGAAEACDGADNNCDGAADEGALSTFYLDADGDGYGGDGGTTEACQAPFGYAAEPGDCNDTDTDYNPGAAEDCADPNDYDCDGSVEYADADEDGAAACEDCDDGDPTLSPAAEEICDGIDNDCDGDVDADDADVGELGIWYLDEDGDGYGDGGDPVVGCEQPAGSVADDTDCDDGEPAAYPGYPEVCDGIDNDCDGDEDEDGAEGSGPVYADADGDGFGDASSPRQACGLPGGYVADDTDCDDADGGAFPGNDETCDGADDDCDGDTDEDSAIDADVWHYDGDGDGYGVAGVSDVACDQPPGYVLPGSDCDDADAGISPSDAEIAYDGIDQNCSGADLTDVDGDGHDGLAAGGSDCDDGDASASPSEPEVCDGIDNDCDGESDETSAIDADAWYADGDGDGYGDDEVSVVTCDGPEGYALPGGDCDDGDGALNPGMDEACGDGLDNDCDGLTDDGTAADASAWHPDADGDGYGSEDESLSACDQPDGYVADGSDCDDADAGVSAGCGDFDGTTGTTWEKLTVSASEYVSSLMTYHPSDFDSLYNICTYTQQYDPSADAWASAAATPPYSCLWTQAAPWDGDLWLIRNSSVYHYDPDGDVWSTLATISGADDNNMTEADEDGVIYGHTASGQIVAYDAVTGAINYYTTGLGSQLITRMAYDPDERAIFFGAFWSSSLYRFDVDTHVVTTMASHPESILNIIFCGDRSGHIYAAGDLSGTTVYQYTIATDSWKKIPDLPTDHGLNGSCTVSEDGWLYVGLPDTPAFYRLELY